MLPEPHFVDRDPRAILRECIERYEELAERALVPSQVERLIIDLIAYRETLVRVAIQEAAKQNLRRYARYPMIDYLAEILGAERLPARRAATTERFALAEARPIATIIPEGTRVRSKDGRVTFRLDVDAIIGPGETFVDEEIVATEAGPAANGYAPGQVSVLVDSIPGVTASNLTETSGGAPAEDSDRLRDRMPLVVDEDAVAGPEAAYRALSLRAHPDVLDVHVGNPAPMVVEVTVLASYGVPSSALLDTVRAELTPETRRPIGDIVEVAAASPHDYTIVARLQLYRGARAADAVAAAERAAELYRDQRGAGLGRSPVPSQIVAALKVPGVYSVAVDEPGEATVGRTAWARCTAITIYVDGFVDEEEPREVST